MSIIEGITVQVAVLRDELTALRHEFDELRLSITAITAVTPSVKTEVKTEPRPESKPESKPEVKAPATPVTVKTTATSKSQ